MMNYIELLINIIESLLYALITSDYIGITSRNRINYILIFTIVFATEITVLNQITLYDGLYSVIYIITYASMITWFDDSDNSAAIVHNIIYAINFDSLISIGNEIVFLFATMFFSISPLQMVEKHLIITFAASRFILIFISIIIHKYTRFYKQLTYSYDRYFVVAFTIMHVLIVLNENQIFRDNGSTVFFIVSNLMICILVFITYFIYCVSLNDSFKNKQADHLSLQLSNIEENASLFIVKENEIRTMKHDLINQLTIMDGYLRDNDISSCQEIIRKGIGKLNQMPVWINSGYTAIDAILSVKFSLAKSKAIQVNSFIQLAELTKEQEYDIALILGNLIDNAIENIASENKNIVLRITQKEQLNIVVENTTDQTASNLSTGKPDKVNHGLGLNSIRLLAKKHNGYLSTDLSDNVFIAIVVLNLKTEIF